MGGACISGSSRLCEANTCTPFASASLDLARQQRALLVVGGVGLGRLCLGFPRFPFFFFCILAVPLEQSMTELVRGRGAVLPLCGMRILPLPFPEGAGSRSHQAAAKPPGIHLQPHSEGFD